MAHCQGDLFYSPAFLLYAVLFEGETWRVVETAIAALLGLLCFAAASEGFHMVSLGVLYRVLFLVAAVLMLWPFQEIVSFLKIVQVSTMPRIGIWSVTRLAELFFLF